MVLTMFTIFLATFLFVYLFVSICCFSMSHFAVLYKYWGWLLLVISIVNSCILETVVSIPVVSHPCFLLCKYIVPEESLFVSSSKWRVVQRAVLHYDANGTRTVEPRVEGWLIVDVLQTKTIPSLIPQWLRQGLQTCFCSDLTAFSSVDSDCHRDATCCWSRLLITLKALRFVGVFRAHRSYDPWPTTYDDCWISKCYRWITPFAYLFAGLGWTNSLTLVPPMKRRSGALITSSDS